MSTPCTKARTLFGQGSINSSWTFSCCQSRHEKRTALTARKTTPAPAPAAFNVPQKPCHNYGQDCSLAHWLLGSFKQLVVDTQSQPDEAFLPWKEHFPCERVYGECGQCREWTNTGFHDCSARDKAVISPSALLQLHKQAAEVQLVDRLTLSHALPWCYTRSILWRALSLLTFCSSSRDGTAQRYR